MIESADNGTATCRSDNPTMQQLPVLRLPLIDQFAETRTELCAATNTLLALGQREPIRNTPLVSNEARLGRKQLQCFLLQLVHLFIRIPPRQILSHIVRNFCALQ